MKKTLLLLLIAFTCQSQQVNKFYIPSNYAEVTAGYMPSGSSIIWYTGDATSLKQLSDYFNFYDSMYHENWLFQLIPVGRDSVQALHTFTFVPTPK